jgi:hypothetical protein
LIRLLDTRQFSVTAEILFCDHDQNFVNDSTILALNQEYFKIPMAFVQLAGNPTPPTEPSSPVATKTGTLL